MVFIIDPSILAATGGAIFMIGFGLLVQKAKEEIKNSNSYLVHYFTPILLLGLGVTLFFMGVSLKVPEGPDQNHQILLNIKVFYEYSC